MSIAMNEPNRPDETIVTEQNATEAAFDPALVQEPEYEEALDALLDAIADGQDGAYFAVAQRWPRYAVPLLDAALLAVAAERRMQSTGEPSAETVAAVTRGMEAARRQLGLAGAEVRTEAAPAASVSTFADERKRRGWTVGDLAPRLRLPSALVVKIERGQFARWPEKLAAAVAEAFETSLEQAQAILTATTGTYRAAAAAAYSAQGAPQANIVAERRQEGLVFDEELARAGLTAEQAAWWNAAE